MADNDSVGGGIFILGILEFLRLFLGLGGIFILGILNLALGILKFRKI